MNRTTAHRGRRCVFCGRGPTTREHAFPKWMAEVLPGTGAFTNVVPGVQWTSLNPDIQTRSVCAQCNNGWMSRLETATKPNLSAMLSGLYLPLDTESQQTLAAWACKTALVLDRVGAAEVSPVLPDRLMAEHQPADDWHVWLAGHSSPHLSCMFAGSVLYDLDDRRHHYALLDTIALGTVVFQVLAPIGGEEVRQWLRPNFPTIRIWPPLGPVEWPPAAVLTDSDLVALAGRAA